VANAPVSAPIAPAHTAPPPTSTLSLHDALPISTPDHPALVSASPVPHQPAGYGLRETIPAAARPYQVACLAASVADVRTSLRRSRHTDCQAYEAAHFWPAVFPGPASFPGCASTWLAVR